MLTKLSLLRKKSILDSIKNLQNYKYISKDFFISAKNAVGNKYTHCDVTYT